MRSSRRAALGLSLVAVIVMSGCGSSDSSSPPSSSSAPSSAVTTTSASTVTTTQRSTTTPPPHTIDEAIRAFLVSAGLDYAGDCADTTVDRDTGKHCSKLHEDRSTERIYATGPTFSEFDTWLLLRQQADGWSVVDSASTGSLDSPAPPPW